MITVSIPLLILIVLALGTLVSVIGMANAGGAGGGIPFARAACGFGVATIVVMAFVLGGH